MTERKFLRALDSSSRSSFVCPVCVCSIHSSTAPVWVITTFLEEENGREHEVRIRSAPTRGNRFFKCIKDFNEMRYV